MDDIEKLKERLMQDAKLWRAAPDLAPPKAAELSEEAAQAITDLQAENADLREALERIRDHSGDVTGARYMIEIARKALGAKA